MTSPKRLLSSTGLRPKKKLGQNFLTDPTTAETIVSRSEITNKDVALEIGAGLGALTVPLARAAGKVYAVEVDHAIIPLLETELKNKAIENVTILKQNILKADINSLAEIENRKLTVFGNLPYNISSQILIRLIRFRDNISRCILMFQKELAHRMSSGPGSREYGRITVILRYCGNIRSLAQVNPAVFYPKPSVDSEVLEITFKAASELHAIDEEILFQVIKAAFSKRRKTLKNALAGSDLFDDADRAKAMLIAAGIDPIRRAETLSVEEFVRLANAVSSQIKT